MSPARFTADEIVRATRATHRPAAAGSGSGREPAAKTPASCSSVSTDSRELAPGALFVALSGPRFDGHSFLSAVASAKAFGAIVGRGAPGVESVEGALDLFEVDDTLVALGKLGLFHRERHSSLKVAAITGSNGKTTTKEMLGASLSPLGKGLRTKGNLNNRIGVPLTLFGLEQDHLWAAIEMGMNERKEILELTEMARPQLGLVTTASEVHLGGLGSVDAVAEAKAELYQGLRDGCVAVVNLDDPRLPSLAEAAGAIEAGGRLRRVTYGAHPRADVRLGDVKVGADGMLRFQALISRSFLGEYAREELEARDEDLGPLILDVRLPLLGRHNAHNACGALAAAMALGVPPRDASLAISSTRALERRLQPRPGPSGSLVLDDCYNSGPASVRAALETGAELASARGGRLLAVLGDMLELGEREEELHRGIGEAAVRLGVSHLFTTGKRSMAASEAAKEAGARFVCHEDEPTRIVDALAELISAEDVILVKGSRGAALERVSDPLSAMAEGKEAGR